MNSDGGVLIAAGGTGGHVFPAVAVARELRRHNIAVHWIGSRAGVEAGIAGQERIPFFPIRVAAPRGRGPTSWLRLPKRLFLSLIDAWRALSAVRPGCVLGMGGYSAGPCGLVAWSRGLPLVIHEQNAIAGLTNRLLAPLAARVLEGMAGAFTPADKVVLTGNPVRGQILATPAPEERFRGRSAPLRLLVLGGSQGARPLNRQLPAIISKLQQSVPVLVRHQCGQAHVEDTRRHYAVCGLEAEIHPFIDAMAEAYAWADLVVARAGAMTLAELAAAGLGSLLIPFPHATDDHQTANASHFERAGASLSVAQERLTDVDELAALLVELAGDRDRLLAMAGAARRLARASAAAAVAEHCRTLVGSAK